ncbi:MAG: hypothetical protein UR51_C0009G0020 [Candidatus Moranbacteria bacterium GW2011_GWF1_34_10]|nr:MAG: hypothetical protein UR51_C0009G0020 [Candidatus Moranbacteria bacterium GW2011_GWF1_34_10]
MAVTQNALGKKDESINSLIDAVNNDKKNLTYLFNLGRAYQEKGGETEIDNARKIFEYIVSVSPDEVNTNFALGTLYEKKGEKDKAIASYNKVLETIKKIDTNNEETISKLNKIIGNLESGISNVDIVNNQPIENSQPVEASNPNQEVNLIGPDQTQDPVNQITPPGVNQPGNNDVATPPTKP